MRRFLAVFSLVGMSTALAGLEAYAQSGVISGPPLARPAGGPVPGGGFPSAGYPGGGMPGGGMPGGGIPGGGMPGGGIPGGAGASIVGSSASTWIAVAGGFNTRGDRVAVGYSGAQPTREEAERAALRACQRGEQMDMSCRAPIAVATGCLFIAPGNRRGGGVTWGRGGTRDIALQECRRGGYVCPPEKMIGGCVPGAN